MVSDVIADRVFAFQMLIFNSFRLQIRTNRKRQSIASQQKYYNKSWQRCRLFSAIKLHF